LEEERPEYLLVYPSNAAELARAALLKNVRLGSLREVRTMGEALSADTRALCREAWGAPVVDMYSAEEVGYIALQCPEHQHYHVQSESLLVEVLDDDGNACRPGETGRVVVTDLHNFAMPLVRYEIGDYAEVGTPCPCGRGLPVLARISGRVRNMLVTADGRRYFPHFGTRSMPGLEVLRQHQFVQKSLQLVEGRLVSSRPLTTAEEEALRRHVLSRLPAGFEVRFSYCERIARSPTGKFEDFMSELG
jgi:phenylacetate-CoA ligase